MIPRVQGFHHHLFGNLADVQTAEHDPGDVLTLDEDLNPSWEPSSSSPHDIISTTHTDTDTGDTPNDGDVLTYDTGDSKWHPAAPVSTGYDTVEDEGTPVTQRSTLNFTGSGVSVSDVGGETVVDISAGSGGLTDVRSYLSFGVNQSGQQSGTSAAQTAPAFQAHGSGNYYGAPAVQFTPTSASYIANFIRATPFYVPYDGTYDRAALEVVSGAAGNNRIGIWGPIPSSGAINALPLVLDTGNISTGTTGVKTATISQALSQGWYMIGQVSDSTNTLRAYPAGALIHEIGDSVPFGGNRTKNYYFASFTYGALPNPITTLAPAGDSDLMTMVQLRKQ